jgi:hypothetical protein
LRWTKRGLLFTVPGDLDWARTHAALPIVEPLDAERARVYFSARDERSRAQIGCATINLVAADPKPNIDREPVIRLGPRGTFDDSGATGGCMVEHAGARYLYYSGWSLAADVPFLFFVGCAISTNGGRSFEKVSRAPLLGRDDVDPYLTASPSILIEGGTWRMWYVSGTGWSDGPRPEPNYLIRYAESTDGIEWRRTGHICIGYSYPGEHAIARPHIVKDGSVYRMWYSHRGDAYRIGFAESNDGLEWTRHDDDVGITTSPEGWDSEMVCYPWVGDVAGKRRMLYNGNGYGRTGIGQAVLAED